MTDNAVLFDRVVAGPTGPAPLNIVSLPFEMRQRSRLRVTISEGDLAGRSVGIELPRGTVMRAGVLLMGTGDVYLRVDAAPEQLMQVEADTALGLTAIAYHLGNRHVPVQLGPQWVRLQRDHVLEQMVVGLGGQVSAIDAPFEPESGAYHGGGGHHHHDHDHSHDHDDGHHHAPPDRRHAPRIHDLADPDAST